MGPMHQDDLPNELTAACPSFAMSMEWQDFWHDYGSEEKPLYYLLIAGLVRHIIRLLAEGTTEELPALFSLVERMVDDEDRYLATLAVVGFLEDLQNTNLHLATTSPADFERFLEPHSAWWWEEVRLFWEGGVVPIGSSGRPRPEGMRWP